MIKKSIIIFSITICISFISYMLGIFFLCKNNQSFYCPEVAKLAEFYAKNIRGHLFAGFLALGGFLLSLKTFIIVNMKENVYDNYSYIKNWNKNKQSDDKIYSPLKELSDLLFYAILSSISSAVLQMTVGLYSHWLTTIICLFSALYATFLLVYALYLIKRNLDTWFEYLDEG